jgi:hypothetical protein
MAVATRNRKTPDSCRENYYTGLEFHIKNPAKLSGNSQRLNSSRFWRDALYD